MTRCDIKSVRIGDTVEFLEDFPSLSPPELETYHPTIPKGTEGIVVAIDSEHRFITVEVLLPHLERPLKVNVYSPPEGVRSSTPTVSSLRV